MSLVTLSEVRALVKSGLADADFQAVIDREESWLAGRIGALAGARTDTFYPGLTDAPIYLGRRAASVVVTDKAVAVSDIRFASDTGLVRRTSGYWTGPVVVTWTPTDTDVVKRGVIELVRGTLTETGYDSETIGDYAYSRGEARGSRIGVVRSILLRRPAYSTRLRSSMEPA